MVKTTRCGIVGVLIAATTLVGIDDAAAADDLARQGFALVKQYCYQCHGVGQNGDPLFNVLDRDGLVEEGYLVLGKPVEESLIWRRIASGEMPPAGAAQPTAEEKQLIQEWIAAGAPAGRLPSEGRPRVSEADVLSRILADLRGFSPRDAAFKRYFTLHHLANNASVNDFELRLYRAALSKAINSLTRANKIVLPQAVGEGGVLFRIDLRELQWDRSGIWSQLVVNYPYALRYSDAFDENLRRFATQLEEVTQPASLVYLRGDWFAVTATRPPLYSRFLQHPDNDRQLEQMLGVDIAENFLASPARLHRAGFDESGVSSGARVVERHALPNGGYYWKSYDFAPENTRAVLSRFPLGPGFFGNDYADRFGFRADGGEIIYSLPNGLQGYMLVDAAGKRIEKGPIRVVRDLNETSGTPEVVNGISCMHCHRQGMIRFEDSVRDSRGLGGDPLAKVLELYTPAEKMADIVSRDSGKFLLALDTAISPFLRTDDDRTQPVVEFAEPIGAVARLYQRDLSLEDAASELGVSTERLKETIKHQDQLRFHGLGPLTVGRRINRAAWENSELGASSFQRAAVILKIGEPLDKVL